MNTLYNQCLIYQSTVGCSALLLVDGAAGRQRSGRPTHLGRLHCIARFLWNGPTGQVLFSTTPQLGSTEFLWQD